MSLCNTIICIQICSEFRLKNINEVTQFEWLEKIDDTSAVLDDAPNFPAKFAAFKNDINGVISDEYAGKEYHSGFHFMFYRSKIDNQWLRYAVYLPEDL